MTTAAKTLISTVFILFIHFSVAWLENRPQDVGPDVAAGKLRSLSFAPFHEGFSPIAHKFPPPEHIDSDIALVADKTYNLRTYTVREGMQLTPDLARKYGVSLLLGAWLSGDHASNQLEIDTQIKTANTHTDVVKRVIVGNEVLLRKDMDIDALIAYIRQVKRAIKQPVSYADVWSNYLQYPQLFEEVDFITIHILPYWEDEPISIEQAAAHVEKIVELIEAKARALGIHKPILIGESGWPAAGRQRGQAVPSVVNAARFIRELIQIANRHGYDYNIVEAFNQPWKSHHEGVVGANWGLLSVDREPVFPLTGPVNENPHWLPHFFWSSGLFLLLAAMYRKKLPTPFLHLILFLALMQIFSISIVSMTRFMWYTSYNDWQRAYCVLMLIANALLACTLLLRYSGIFGRTGNPPILAKRLTAIYSFFALLAVYKTYSLALNGRYLSFPNEQFAIPVYGLLGLMLCSRITNGRSNRSESASHALLGNNGVIKYGRVLAYVLYLSVIALVIGETRAFLSAYDFIQAHPSLSEGLPVALSYTLQNGQLLTWLLFVAILAIPFRNNSTRKKRS